MITIGLFSIFSFNIIYFHKFMEYLTGSAVKVGLNASGFFQPEADLNYASILTNLSLFILVNVILV